VSTIDTVCDVGDYYQALAAQVVTIITSEGNDSSLRSWQGLLIEWCAVSRYNGQITSLTVAVYARHAWTV